MFPEAGYTSVGQGVVAVCLVAVLYGYERVAAVGLLRPLHTETRIGQYLFARLPYGLRSLAVMGKSGILLAEPVVVVDKVDGTEAAVLLYLSHHPSYAVAVIGVVLAVECHTVVAGGKEDAALGYVPPHPLVHNGLEGFLQVHIGILVFGLRAIVGLGISLGHIVLGEEHLRGAPRIAVGGGLHHGARWRHMLLGGVAEVVEVELVVPVGHHGLVVVGPAVTVLARGVLAVGAHSLYVVYSHYGRQATVVARRVGHGGAGVVYAVLFQQGFHNALGGTEYGAVLMVLGYAHLVAHVGEVDEVAGIVRTEVEETVAVIIYKVAVAQLTSLGQLYGGGAFHEVTSEGFGSLAPRTVGTLGKRHLDVALVARVVLQHHDIVVLAALEHSGVYATESRVYQQFARCPCLEVLGNGIVQTMVVLLFLYAALEVLAGHARCPHHHRLLAVFIPE